MIALTFRLELRRSRAIALWLALIGFAYGAIMATMYPILQKNSQLLEDYMKIFPREVMAAFGMSGTLTDPGVFFSTYIGSFLWPVVAAVGAIVLATRPVAADVERGWADMTLGTPLARSQGLAAAIISQALVLGVIAMATVGGIIALGGVVGAGFDGARFLAGGAILWLFACAIAAVTSFVAALTLNRGVSAGVVAGVILAMYLVNIVAQVQVDVAWVGGLGWPRYLAVTELIDTGVVPWASVAAFGLVAILGWAASLAVFRRRDLLA